MGDYGAVLSNGRVSLALHGQGFGNGMSITNAASGVVGGITFSMKYATAAVPAVNAGSVAGAIYLSGLTIRSFLSADPLVPNEASGIVDGGVRMAHIRRR